MLGGCGMLLVVAIVVIVGGAILLAHTIGSSGNCLPADFPVDPGMTKVTAFRLAGTCTAAYRTNGSSNSVENYYLTALNENGWQVLSHNATVIRFQRAARPAEAGAVTVTTRRGSTAVGIGLHGG